MSIVFLLPTASGDSGNREKAILPSPNCNLSLLTGVSSRGDALALADRAVFEFEFEYELESRDDEDEDLI